MPTQSLSPQRAPVRELPAGPSREEFRTLVLSRDFPALNTLYADLHAAHTERPDKMNHVQAWNLTETTLEVTVEEPMTLAFSLYGEDLEGVMISVIDSDDPFTPLQRPSRIQRQATKRFRMKNAIAEATRNPHSIGFSDLFFCTCRVNRRR